MTSLLSQENKQRLKEIEDEFRSQGFDVEEMRRKMKESLDADPELKAMLSPEEYEFVIQYPFSIWARWIIDGALFSLYARKSMKEK